MPLTLGDYLIEGGAKGRWFYDSHEQRKYTVTSVQTNHGRVIFAAEFERSNSQELSKTLPLVEHLDDPEIEVPRQPADDPKIDPTMPLPKSLIKTLDNLGKAAQIVDEELEREGLL